ncbi:hypothetical protein [Lysobacter sp. TAB13]|uniref:hypothetical protein n=1 Tax=Lysobacter sp. TAB13 TaxID=3233065 RepID=UPI003F97E1E2
MGVVINEFEVLAEPQRAAKADEAGKEGEAPAKIDLHDLQVAQRELERCALRLWAH